MRLLCANFCCKLYVDLEKQFAQFLSCKCGSTSFCQSLEWGTQRDGQCNLVERYICTLSKESLVSNQSSVLLNGLASEASINSDISCVLFDCMHSWAQVIHEETGTLLRVPFRRIHLTDPDPGCAHLDVYDTSGPLGFEPKKGLPKLRQPWIQKREERGDERMTQVLVYMQCYLILHLTLVW